MCQHHLMLVSDDSYSFRVFVSPMCWLATCGSGVAAPSDGCLCRVCLCGNPSVRVTGKANPGNSGPGPEKNTTDMMCSICEHYRDHYDDFRKQACVLRRHYSWNGCLNGERCRQPGCKTGFNHIDTEAAYLARHCRQVRLIAKVVLLFTISLHTGCVTDETRENLRDFHIPVIYPVRHFGPSPV